MRDMQEVGAAAAAKRQPGDDDHGVAGVCQTGLPGGRRGVLDHFTGFVQLFGEQHRPHAPGQRQAACGFGLRGEGQNGGGGPLTAGAQRTES